MSIAQMCYSTPDRRPHGNSSFNASAVEFDDRFPDGCGNRLVGRNNRSNRMGRPFTLILAGGGL